MSEGILLVDKPPQKTSFFLVSVLRKITKIRKIGHAGTLDPLATGVMVMLIGKNFTKQASHLQGHNKAYIATVELGKTSDSYDADGTISMVSSLIPSRENIERALLSFQGTVNQVPPMFSAKKMQGKKLCDLARKGISVERRPVKVTLQTELVEYSYPYLKLSIKCSSGTYIRSIAHDLGQILGVGGFITRLTRIQSGRFTLSQCVDFPTLVSENFVYQDHLLDYKPDATHASCS